MKVDLRRSAHERAGDTNERFVVLDIHMTAQFLFTGREGAPRAHSQFKPVDRDLHDYQLSGILLPNPSAFARLRM